MPEPAEAPKRRRRKKRPSKAALRREAFNSVRLTPMRARAGAEEAEADATSGGKTPTPAEQSQPPTAGPDYLAAMQAYRAQQQARAQQKALVSNRWTPIGPSAVRKGQAGNRPVISGRVSSIAVAPGGARIYVGAANGGVWRSEDRGATWTPLMEAFDVDPQRRGADSLAVGALALVAGETTEEDILYVGSGEAIDGGADPTAGPMFGVGPIVSTDGGQNWQTELGAPGGPWSFLVGNGFYELAVDPADPTRVLGATLTGLFLREPAPLSTGFYRWRHITLPNQSPATPVTSVVAARASGGSTVFYAACMGGPVFRSLDGGESWSEVGIDFPGNAGRVRLAVEAQTPEIVYLFTTTFGLYRLDVADGRWRHLRQLTTSITGLSMPQAANVNGQWNLSIAVTPGNVDRVYIGGGASAVDSNGWLNTQNVNFGATLFRCDVTATTNPATGAVGNLSTSLHYIGGAVHPDVHAIVFPPDSAEELWIGCDGGVFYSDNPPGEDGGLIPSSSGQNAARFYFEARNTGLQTLMMHHLGQHPTEEAVLFGGTQDNGCLRYTGEAAWLHAQSGDCGFVVVNPQDPYKVVAGLQFDAGAGRPLMVRSNFGGNLGSFNMLTNRPSSVDTRTLFYYPLAGPPPGSSAPGLIAFGSLQVYISENFGRDWRTVPSGNPTGDALLGPIRAIEFASADCFYVGTHTDGGAFQDMGIYRFDRVGTTFLPTRLDLAPIPPGNVPLPLLPFDGSVSDIAIDWADPTGRSIYVTFSGYGNFGHVWHHDGLFWRRRDGGNPGQPGSLLDVSHNAIVVDPEDPETLFVGADIGIWRSLDAGQTWHPFSEGLPDAAVVDLKLHPRRVLRAATHGRGVFERRLEVSSIHHIELYIRDTQLDLGKRTTIDGLDNPLQKHTQVWHWKGPDIKLDFPNFSGAYQFAAGQVIDFAEFTDELNDDGLGAGHTLQIGTEHRVYAQIHNRGSVEANGVQVTALITHATTGLPPLPWNYEERVQQGLPITNDDWETIGVATLDGVGARTPQIAHFVIPPDKLPPPSDEQGSFAYSVLVLVHHPEDEYPITPWQTSITPGQPTGSLQFRIIPPVDVVCKTRRQAAIKSTTQQAIVLHAAEWQSGTWNIPFTLAGASGDPLYPRLRFRFKKFPGRIRLYSPEVRLIKRWRDRLKGFKPHQDLDDFLSWAKPYVALLEKRLGSKGGSHPGWTKARIAACKAIAKDGMVLEATGAREAIFDGIELTEKDRHTFFLQLSLPKEMLDKEQQYEIEILHERKNQEGGYELAGGQTVPLILKAQKRT